MRKQLNDIVWGLSAGGIQPAEGLAQILALFREAIKKARIAELCCEHEGHEWESLPDNDEGRLCKPRFRRDALCILDAIGEEIKKVEPSIGGFKEDIDIYDSGFEQCRQDALALVGKEDNDREADTS